ncbi:MAG TPA: hypothetical protein RMH80_10755, partial [Polyangiaceae bacterium LLY-WYZ-15_(1-7)]|nr:hypothetical protein [Polyangiaceae bacterium LLY-WYZ-15_(1-7)]
MAEAAEQHEEKPTERAEEELEGPEIRRLRRAIRRRRRLALLAIGGNAIVALVMLGGPYWRGRERAL